MKCVDMVALLVLENPQEALKMRRTMNTLALLCVYGKGFIVHHLDHLVSLALLSVSRLPSLSMLAETQVKLSVLLICGEPHHSLSNHSGFSTPSDSSVSSLSAGLV